MDALADQKAGVAVLADQKAEVAVLAGQKADLKAGPDVAAGQKTVAKAILRHHRQKRSESEVTIHDRA